MSFTFLIAVGIAISAFFVFVASVFQAWNIYRNPNLKPHPVINREEMNGSGFKWIQRSSASGIIPPIRTSEGAIWSGLSFGISRENGKVYTIGISVYGAEQGVGHYTWRARSNTFESEVGAGGHFNIDRIIGEEQWRREMRILGYAVDEASRGVNGYYRPLKFEIDKKSDKITIYDQESGRYVFANKSRESPIDDNFIFGPPPMAYALIPYVRQPGLYINEPLALEKGITRLTFKAWDVYGRSLDYVIISVSSDSGYEYTQALFAEQTDKKGLVVTLPSGLSHIHLEITRGGFHSITSDVALKEGNQPIDVFMEPLIKADSVDNR